jgi:hypothetical protein
MANGDYRDLVIQWAKSHERIGKKIEAAQKRIAEIEQEKAEVYDEMVELMKKLTRAEEHMNLFLDLLEGKDERGNGRSSKAPE